MVWRELPPATPAPRTDDPTGALRWAGWLSAVTALAAVLAAGAETWRFVLMLQGRTLVLSGSAVRASDLLVAASGIAVGVLALLTVALAVPALVRTYAVASWRLQHTPARRPGAIVARLLVPLWNIYGAGQVVTEIDRALVQARAASHEALSMDAVAREAVSEFAAPPVKVAAEAEASTDQASSINGALAGGSSNGGSMASARSRPARASLITTVWWLSWMASAVLILVTLARGFGGSLQAIADTVQLHIAVDLVAAVVAGLGAAMLLRFAGLLREPADEYAGWVVQPPGPARELT